MRRLVQSILRAMRSVNPLPRFGAVFRTDLATLVSAVLATVVALFVTVLSYAFLSGFGSSYDFAKHITPGGSSFREYGDFSFFMEPTGPQTGNKLTLYHDNSPIVTVRLVGTEGGISLKWNYQWSLWERIDLAEGPSRREGELSLISSSGSYLWMPYVQNTTIDIPSGTIFPVLQSLMRYGEVVADSQFDENEERAALAIMNDYFSETGLSLAYNQAIDSAFWSGGIQFLTLFTFVLFFLFSIVTLFSDRLSPAAGFLMESLPYLGFFGTLVGMGQALQILGFANLSDGLQKAISLGPIGSQMGLAIETTKFALVFYLAAGAISHFIDVSAERIRVAAGVEESPLGPVR